MADYSYKLSEIFSLIPEYDGDQITLSNFIRSCSSAFSITKDEQKDLLIVHLRNKLKGRAANIINSRDFTDWGSIKAVLTSHFGEKRDTTSLIHDLQLLFQNPNESAVSFYNRVQIHFSKITNSIELSSDLTAAEKENQTEFCEGICLRTVLTGLQPSIRTVIRSQNPEDLCDVGKLIVEEEKLMYLEKTRNQNLNPRKSNSEQFVNHVKPKTFFCSYCKRPNHKISECRKLQSRNFQNNTNSHFNTNFSNNNNYNRYSNHNNFSNFKNNSQNNSSYRNQSNNYGSNTQNHSYRNQSNNYGSNTQNNYNPHFNQRNYSNFHRNKCSQNKVNHLNESRSPNMGNSTPSTSTARPMKLGM